MEFMEQRILLQIINTLIMKIWEYSNEYDYFKYNYFTKYEKLSIIFINWSNILSSIQYRFFVANIDPTADK